jgi:hypothetical protein
MLESLVGSVCRERVLMYLFARDKGYPREIAQYYSCDLSPIQKQLERLEFGGICTSRTEGKTRIYSFNPRYPFLGDLRGLLKKALSFYSAADANKLTGNRRRPRRKGKPL